MPCIEWPPTGRECFDCNAQVRGREYGVLLALHDHELIVGTLPGKINAVLCLPADAIPAKPDLVETEDPFGNVREELFESIPADIEAKIGTCRNVRRRPGSWRSG